MFWMKDSHLVGYTQQTHLKWHGFGYDLVKIAMCYRVYVYALLTYTMLKVDGTVSTFGFMIHVLTHFLGTVSYVFGPHVFVKIKERKQKKT